MTFAFRWIKIRKRVSPFWVNLITPISNAPVMSIGIALTGSSFFGLNAPFIFFAHMAAYCLTDLYMLRLMNGEALSLSIPEYCLAWLWQELSAAPAFLHTLATDNGYVVWRDKLCKLDKNGDIEQISQLGGGGKSVQSKVRVQKATHVDVPLVNVK
jgi:ceramide glucosyltransferase